MAAVSRHHWQLRERSWPLQDFIVWATRLLSGVLVLVTRLSRTCPRLLVLDATICSVGYQSRTRYSQLPQFCLAAMPDGCIYRGLWQKTMKFQNQDAFVLKMILGSFLFGKWKPSSTLWKLCSSITCDWIYHDSIYQNKSGKQNLLEKKTGT